jgi:molybdopterin/thiamine biosynthesis adenylyltransferase
VFISKKKNLLDQNCENEGVIPTVAGSVGTLSSMQAISIILGDEECFNKLILINMKAGKIAQSFLSENPGCIICS